MLYVIHINMVYILYKYVIISITLKPVELQGIDSQTATPLLLKE